MHRAVMKLIIVFLVSLIVGMGTAAATTRSHASLEPSHTTTSTYEMDNDGDAELGRPARAGTCHEACHWLVIWHWPMTEQNQRVHPDMAIDTQLPGVICLVLPPPRMA